MSSENRSIATRSVHAGSPRPRICGAIGTPIFQSSTFEYHGEAYHDVGYLRLSNSPNHRVLHERIAALEGTEDALCTASGMAAITTALLTVMSSGDHFLVQDCLYGGTSGLIADELTRFGVTHSVIDPEDASSWQLAVRPNTKAIYVETLSNPLIRMPDLEQVTQFATGHELVSMIDNTFASPVNFRPAGIGFDLTLESCTKYLNGHNDLVAGSIAGSSHWISRIKRTLDHLGGALDPHACFLLERGLKTLEMRVGHQNRSAQRIAEFLDAQPGVSIVHYPGLPSHPQHAEASRLLDGFGGMLSFELAGDVDEAERFLARLTLPAVAPSLGGAESLIVRPAAAVHSGLSAEERERSGITDTLIRFSIGLETTDDLIADLEQALVAETAVA